MGGPVVSTPHGWGFVRLVIPQRMSVYRKRMNHFRAAAANQSGMVRVQRKLNHGIPRSKRYRGGRNLQLPFMPPEDWHEPQGGMDGYRVVVQEPGKGYRHVVTEEEVRQRLSLLPVSFTAPLEVVQLSKVTRKKQSFPCYGMQWGSAIYLYPIEEGLVEYFARPPHPSQWNEARMFGGRWVQDGPTGWRLEWTEETIKDFYLNNILIHELGHLLDDRNNGYVDRERYAEWFAIRYGYQPTQRQRSARQQRTPANVVRRHHSK